MRLITNPGSNLPDSALERYGVLLSRQQIVVDRTAHDTRKAISLKTVDEWVSRAREFPKVVGSTSQDMVPLFLEALETDPQVLVVTTSRRLITTHDSALTAAAATRGRSTHKQAEIAVVDSRTTDVGAALLTIAAGEAARAGKSMPEIVKMLEAMAEHGHMIMSLHTLDNMHKSGRASFLKAWMAAIMQVRPLIGMSDGELRVIGRLRVKDDPVQAVCAELEARVPAGSRIWLGVAHGNVPELAVQLRAECERRWNVELTLVRELSSSIYLYSGPGTLAAFAVPLAELPFEPPIPSPPLA